MTEPGSTIETDLAALEGLTARELRERYERVFGEAARSNNRRWLLRRVAWRMQLLAEGDLAQRAVDRARDKAATLARDADLRVRPPSGPLDPGEPARTVVGQMSPGRDERVPPPGAVLVRVFKGREHRVAERELQKLLDPGVSDGESEADAIPAPPDEAITQPGDLWILGEHRLLCGDSSNAGDVRRLLDGEPVQLVNTDPPYNVAVQPRSKNAFVTGQTQRRALLMELDPLYCDVIVTRWEQFTGRKARREGADQ